VASRYRICWIYRICRRLVRAAAFAVIGGPVYNAQHFHLRQVDVDVVQDRVPRKVVVSSVDPHEAAGSEAQGAGGGVAGADGGHESVCSLALFADFERVFDFGDGPDAVWRELGWGVDELEFSLAGDDGVFAVEVAGRPL
jgi:hypothetical protein